ncbi:hypothetical protein [Paenarthrobacter sp. PH39-S1]|uniref:hypothetical protein n=1 Tax=Paenarthrobacter sp. PH39-S1 TaxID=3046204 RepID=UPI0024B93AB9|nr:hypothetical protein [Paenarthrobacter sp. PH39-S1]MDJ0355725.1 hypothetical protein [Paenarthrobacter sp. PH39-S1]
MPAEPEQLARRRELLFMFEAVDDYLSPDVSAWQVGELACTALVQARPEVRVALASNIRQLAGSWTSCCSHELRLTLEPKMQNTPLLPRKMQLQQFHPDILLAEGCATGGSGFAVMYVLYSES